MPTFLDLVPEQHPHLFPRKRKKDGKLVNTSKTVWVADAAGHRIERTLVRAPISVVGITIHQTACIFGPADRTKAHRRALGVPAHVVAFRDGTYVQGAPLLWFLYHGNDLNARTLGLELEGHYPGAPDDPSTPRREDEDSTWSGDATPLTEEAIATFRAAFEYLVTVGRAIGCPIKYVWAHRQSNKDRRSDPGYEIWGRVVEEFAIPKLGLLARYADTFDDGRPVPREWAPSGIGRY